MAKNRYGKMQGNMQYNRPSGGYQKNLYRQQMLANNVKKPKGISQKGLRIGLIVGGIIAAVIFIFAKEFLFPDRILFSLAFGWTVFNFAVYRGRYRPRIVFAGRNP